MGRDSAATAANRELYAAVADRYRSVQPHLNHSDLKLLHESCLDRILANAGPSPRVLDLGAGDGASTQSFLRRGAHVTAVDLSEPQLANLRTRCSGDLETICGDVWDVIDQLGVFNVIVTNSFLHHVPDYPGLLTRCIEHLAPRGHLFTFQDPLRYDSLSRATYAFSNGCYFAWRVFQGDLTRGLKTRIRRARGEYIAGSREDDAEYHVTRNGVDQDAIAQMLRERGFDVSLIRYFSTQSATLQRVGAALGAVNMFAIVARRMPDA